MSKREGPRRVVLQDYRDTKEREGATDVELPDGTTVRIPPPVLWPEEVASLQAGDHADMVRGCQLILGQEQWDRFVGAGGTSVMLMGIIDDTLKAEGLAVGESSASTGSS
jgi:hypothetical protein